MRGNYYQMDCLKIQHYMDDKGFMTTQSRPSRDNLTQRASVYHARLGSRFRNSLSQVEKEN